MGIIYLFLMTLQYAEMVLITAFLPGRIGFAIWLAIGTVFVYRTAVAFGPAIEASAADRLIIGASVLGYLIGIGIYITRLLTKKHFVPMILVMIGPLMLIEDFGLFDLIDMIVLFLLDITSAAN